MRKIFIIGILFVVGVTYFGLTAFGNNLSASQTANNGISPPPIITSGIFSGERISVFSTLIGNITIGIPVPESPSTIRIYRGYFRDGDLIERRYISSKSITNPIPADQAEDAAKRILEQYGGLPADALPQYSFIEYSNAIDPQTDEVVARIPQCTFVSWRRTIDGMRIEGGSDIIQVELGENGELNRIYKRWRTYTSQGNVSIITAGTAIEKLQAGDVLNPVSDIMHEDVSIYSIRLGYFARGVEEPEVTLEPIWVFYGETTSGEYLPFFMYARQFANFTAAPESGTVPLTVSFTDTSDASPTAWLWDFGDGTNSTEQDPVHTYTTTGIYTITLRASNDLGSDTMERPACITVRDPAPPVADFTASPVTGPAPLIVAFNDTSTNLPTSWFWDFGDGTNATGRDPVHTYREPGTYTVLLDATNEDGTGSVTRTDLITVTSAADPASLIDQLITFIRDQNNLPGFIRSILIGELTGVKESLRQNHPDDAVMGMKVFRITVKSLTGWPLTTAQATFMQDSADAIIAAINLPVNQEAIDQTKTLAADVRSMNLPSSIGSPLLLELEGAVFTLECAKDEAAITHLSVFASTVQAQDGKKIPHDDAVALTARVQEIISTINS